MGVRQNTYRWMVISLLMVITCSGAVAGKIIYVDDDAIGTNAGSSWQNAYTFLQDALADADSAEKPVEIHVAQGVYKPNQGSENRIIGFHLINGVIIKGGYAGDGEPDPNEREIELYETILSGDLNGDDVDVDNPSDLHDEPTRSDNCSSIVVGSHTDQTAVLDGFTITGGRARRHPAAIDHPTGGGGGMLNESGSPTIRNCTFVGNSAEIIGGAVCNRNSNPTFIRCTFTNNWADYGAGMSSSPGVPVQEIGIDLAGCVFRSNSAGISGGGLIIYGGEATLTNCAFIGNSALQGGGMYSFSGNPKLTDCRFIENNAQTRGGGLANRDETSATLIDCVFVDNSSNGWGGGLAGCNAIENCLLSGNVSTLDGGALHGCGEIINCSIIGNKAGGYGGGICTDGVAKLANSIVRDNKALIGNDIYLSLRILPPGRSGTQEEIPSVMAISYSNVGGGEEEVLVDADCTLAWEQGNIDVDPLLAAPGFWGDVNDPNIAAEPNDPNAVWIDGDYHLKSQAGRWDPNSQSWMQDDVTSPCIDAGDPNSCLGFHEPYPNGLLLNMGAYGGTAQASMSLSSAKCSIPWWAHDYWVEVGEPVCWCYPRQCHGDADCKCQGKQKYWVATNDLDVLIAAYNKTIAEIEGQTLDGVPLICADFDHFPQGKAKFPVSTNDLDILIAHWNTANKPDPDCP